jgi:hypothetical protein
MSGRRKPKHITERITYPFTMYPTVSNVSLHRDRLFACCAALAKIAIKSAQPATKPEWLAIVSNLVDRQICDSATVSWLAFDYCVKTDSSFDARLRTALLSKVQAAFLQRHTRDADRSNGRILNPRDRSQVIREANAFVEDLLGVESDLAVLSVVDACHRALNLDTDCCCCLGRPNMFCLWIEHFVQTQPGARARLPLMMRMDAESMDDWQSRSYEEIDRQIIEFQKRFRSSRKPIDRGRLDWRNVEWLYRYKISGDSQNQIAEREGLHRGAIQHGINRALKLLQSDAGAISEYLYLRNDT